MYFFDDEAHVTREGETDMKLESSSQTLRLRFDDFFSREFWFTEISKKIGQYLKVIKTNIYHAFTNEKHNNFVQFFTDGEEYFPDLFKTLFQAKESVFITDWWMSPEVFLSRPVKEADYYALEYKKNKVKENKPFSRLKDVLFQLAEKGVKIYILIH